MYLYTVPRIKESSGSEGSVLGIPSGCPCHYPFVSQYTFRLPPTVWNPVQRSSSNTHRSKAGSFVSTWLSARTLQACATLARSRHVDVGQDLGGENAYILSPQSRQPIDLLLSPALPPHRVINPSPIFQYTWSPAHRPFYPSACVYGYRSSPGASLSRFNSLYRPGALHHALHPPVTGPNTSKYRELTRLARTVVQGLGAISNPGRTPGNRS
ncbi:hypothetical protein RSAG8_02305, partial [Rhizoctonia solani AG-8 WAC10335]